ncbi:MAG: heme-binding domain-containing protein [Bacteroidota bacterium]
MKKILLFSTAILVVAIIASVTLVPSVANSQKKSKALNPAIPENVMKVFNKSCIACHGAGGNGMAMGVVNFSAWDNYSATKQAKKAKSVCNAVTNGSMPPGSFSGSRPTAAEIKEICDWATSLQPTN